jgi:hypothetical protein
VDGGLSFPPTLPPSCPTMPGLSALPDEILLRVLDSSPDFATLDALAATCRPVRHLYKHYERSFRRTVAVTGAGPDWRQALRAVHASRERDAVRDAHHREMVKAGRMRADADPYESGDPAWRDWVDVPPPWTSPWFLTSNADARALDTIGAAAEVLERLYSQRYMVSICLSRRVLMRGADTETCLLIIVSSRPMSPGDFYAHSICTRYYHRAACLSPCLLSVQIFVATFGLRGKHFFPRGDDELRQADMTRFLDSYTTCELEELQEIDLFIQDAAECAASITSAPYVPLALQPFLDALYGHHTRWAPATLNPTGLTLAMVVRLTNAPERRYIDQWPIHGVRIGALLRDINRKRKLGDWPQQSVSAVFGAPQAHTCEPSSFQPPRVSERDR